MITSVIEYLTIIVLIAASIIASDLQQVFASYLTVMTDKAYYIQGDTVKISGETAPENGQQVSITVTGKQGTSNNANTTLSAENGSYVYKYIAGIPQQYYVEVFSGSLRNSTRFNVLEGYNLKIGDQNYTIGYTITHLPQYGQFYIPGYYEESNWKLINIVPDIQFPKLLIKIQAGGEGHLTIELPRSVIQALSNVGLPAGDIDIPYKVLSDGAPDESVQEVYTDNNTRVLAIDFFNPGIHDIEINGTWLLR
jgi:hypothetical protein